MIDKRAKHMPAAIYASQSSGHWDKLISSTMNSIPTDADLIHIEFLDILKNNLCFGLSSFLVTYEQSGCILSIGINSVTLLSPETKQPLNEIVYNKIITCNNRKNVLEISLRGLSPVIIGTKEGPEIRSVILSYIEELKNHSEWARALETHLVEEDNQEQLLPFAKGALIHLIATVENEKWFRGSVEDRVGIFPADLVEIVLYDPDFEKEQPEEIFVGEESSAEVPLLEFANLKFRTTSAKSKKAKFDITKQMKFSKSPIRESLLQLNESLNRIAVELFTKILVAQGEYPPKNKKKEIEQYISEIIQTGNETLPLRDEIFCQLIKQQHENPKKESVQRIWNMLAIVCGVFGCSPELEPSLLQFLNAQKKRPDIGTLAIYCTKVLDKTLRRGGRKFGPCKQETNALIKRVLSGSLSPLVLKIETYLETFSLLVDPMVNVTEATVELLNSCLKGSTIGTRDGFALCIKETARFGVSFTPLDPDMLIFDLITERENANQNEPEFIFLKRTFVQTSLPRNPVALDLLFAQACYEVHQGIIPVETIQLVIELGVFESRAREASVNESSVVEFIPKPQYKQKTAGEWKDAFEKSAQFSREISPSDAKEAYLRSIWSNPLYGAQRFYVALGEAPNTYVWLNITRKFGVILTSPDHQKILFKFPYAQITGWLISEKQFVINTGTLLQSQSHSFETPVPEQIGDAYRLYSSTALEKRSTLPRGFSIKNVKEATMHLNENFQNSQPNPNNNNTLRRKQIRRKAF